ncbi:hypothetical protein COCCADRAFT_103610 [Bipolaris zeicola 26-R-13]|uniref:Uncharacterized protein n=1 Tax=Cochliobolus carbonum (strain 26-R-13) TaxID=930089 RepID=W6XSI5_COCC2|nr:uncharacterized protein COCCADRAFT_103610 [Bipolaris zeicola 26-R-13]EUC30547.1 hypothetical protein COCCADRAFT_103610 [Bipolaris zeicola 26-R-13]
MLVDGDARSTSKHCHPYVHLHCTLFPTPRPGRLLIGNSLSTAFLPENYYYLLHLLPTFTRPSIL